MYKNPKYIYIKATKWHDTIALNPLKEIKIYITDENNNLLTAKPSNEGYTVNNYRYKQNLITKRWLNNGKLKKETWISPRIHNLQSDKGAIAPYKSLECTHSHFICYP
jgi:hypothetical protein